MKVLVVYYSLYGHMLKMSRAALEGARSVGDIDATLMRVAEFPDLEQWIQGNPQAKAVWDEQQEIPVCTAEDLRTADGLILASPTRYGNMTAQMKQLIDSTASLWLEGAMEGKPVGFMTSTATTHGGQETTLVSMMIPLLHLGMVIVGVPYSAQGMIHTEGRGGTPYGATTLAGPNNELEPAEEDLQIARVQGRRVAEFVRRLGSR